MIEDTSWIRRCQTRHEQALAARACCLRFARMGPCLVQGCELYSGDMYITYQQGYRLGDKGAGGACAVFELTQALGSAHRPITN